MKRQTVVQRRSKLGWIVASWVAVVAQAVPASCCEACDQPCCSARAEPHPPAAAGSAGCPACTAAAAATTACEQPPRSADHPCRCHLNVRQDQPLAQSPDSPRYLSAGDQPAPLAAAPPQAIGVSREYLAAALAVPIRPPRILFGVWRD